MEGNISNLMVSHHALLDALFSLFMDEVKDKSPTAGKSLVELTWEMKKHFFTEENAIFDFLPIENVEMWKTMNQLKDEHLAMLDELKEFSQKMPDVPMNEIERFYDLLTHHREIEELDLYPKLDKELSGAQKEKIILMISQIPIKSK